MGPYIYRRTRGPRVTDGWLFPFGLGSAIGAAFCAYFGYELGLQLRGLGVTEDGTWATFGVTALFATATAFSAAMVVGRLRNTRLGMPVLTLSRDGITAADVFGRMLHISWVDVLAFDLDPYAKPGAPMLLVKTKRGGIGSIELQDTDADPATVVTQIEQMSGRKRG